MCEQAVLMNSPFHPEDSFDVRDEQKQFSDSWEVASYCISCTRYLGLL